MTIENRIGEFEFEICSILAQLSYHIHPTIIEHIKARNIEEIDDNNFPRHIWSFLASGKTYNGPNWRETAGLLHAEKCALVLSIREIYFIAE